MTADEVHDPFDLLEIAPGLSRRTLFLLSALGAATVSSLVALRGDPARAVGWGGHSNGKIPASQLSPIPARVGGYLRADAATAYFALSNAFAARFGTALFVEEGYRDYARQVYLKRQWDNRVPGFYQAAPPGTSVHGWALACDFGSGVNSYGSAQKIWMDATAPRFGWQPRGNTFQHREAWHFEYTGGYTPPPKQEENDLPYTEAQLKVVVREAIIGVLRAPEFNQSTLASALWQYQTSDMPGKAWQTLRDARQIARRAEIEGATANASLAKIAAALKVKL